MTAKLLRHISLYPVLKRFRFKKDIPKGPWSLNPYLVDFGLWGRWYLVPRQGGLWCESGEDMPFHVMYSLCDGVTVIGQRDAEAGKGTKYEEAWRESVHCANLERLGSPCA